MQTGHVSSGDSRGRQHPQDLLLKIRCYREVAGLAALVDSDQADVR